MNVLASGGRRAIRERMLVLLLLLTQVQIPLPDSERFLRATKAEMIFQLDEDELLKNYSYRRKTVHEDLDGDERIKSSAVDEHDVFPLHIGPTIIPDSDDDRQAVIDDLFRTWDFLMLRRESVNGRPAIVIAFAPKKNARPQTDTGRWIFQNARGVVWVDETDHRIVRLHAALINDVSVAWGVLAKVHKGTEIFREWKKIGDETWLPSWSQVHLRARAFVVGFHFVEIEQFSDYQKFDAETNAGFGSPK